MSKKNRFVSFLRKYGPIPRNDNMYDESIQRTSKRLGIKPILFEHPFKKRVFECFSPESLSNVILTGTAGDGKTHLCREIWFNLLNGDENIWASDDPYINIDFKDSKIHFIRDLSAWVPPLGEKWETHAEKFSIIKKFILSCRKIDSKNIFVIAGNDGQLIEALRRVKEEWGTEDIREFREVIEMLLVDDEQHYSDYNLNLFNLSRGDSALLFDYARNALISHEGWEECNYCELVNECPIQINLNLLKEDKVFHRIHTLFKLCDHNGLHLPIRQVLLLLVNAILGHPGAKNGHYLLREVDVKKFIDEGNLAEGSLFSNVFGGNLPRSRRENIPVFSYFERFQIGYETTNRIDNLIIFGDCEKEHEDAYCQLISNDPFYSSDRKFLSAKRDYVESDELEEESDDFLRMLKRYRRGMFFKIPIEKEEEFKLWELTVFRYAGEYLDILKGLDSGKYTVSRKSIGRLVKGMNRIFTGMLIDIEDKLFLSVSGGYSNSKISRVYLGCVSVSPNKGERIVIIKDSERLKLRIHFSKYTYEEFHLNLVRFEFLSRVASNGALPASFSKECYEDLLSFKNKLLYTWNKENEEEEQLTSHYQEIRILISETGKPEEKIIGFHSEHS